jgi:hypothetical protein
MQIRAAGVLARRGKKRLGLVRSLGSTSLKKYVFLALQSLLFACDAQSFSWRTCPQWLQGSELQVGKTGGCCGDMRRKKAEDIHSVELCRRNIGAAGKGRVVNGGWNQHERK